MLVDARGVSVGTFSEPIVLNIQLVHPDKLLFLDTVRSERTMVKVIEYCGFGLSCFDEGMATEIDPRMFIEIKALHLRSGKDVYWFC